MLVTPTAPSAERRGQDLLGVVTGATVRGADLRRDLSASARAAKPVRA